MKTYAVLHGNMQRCRIKSLHGNKLDVVTMPMLNVAAKPLAGMNNAISQAMKPIREGLQPKLPHYDFKEMGKSSPRWRVISRCASGKLKGTPNWSC